MVEEEAITDLDKKIIEAFVVFDHASSNTVDVREVGTIIRSLGCCPSEAEIQEILVAIEDEETSGSIRLDRFLYTVSHIIQERRLLPASPEKLLKAFLTLDHDGKGYLTKEFLSKIMIEEGEPFTQEELDEMMAVVIDGETGNIPYEYYINHLMVNATDDSLIPPPKYIPKTEHSKHMIQ
ncbi:EF-hand calcium-binding domain-containing protein 2 [Zootermopsis nevadensis]|uniref:EF-hand calcium-binding domain-containing protein 2 n=1 Tax=Zootermopsis nevadensis TaxID=136037 RepID=UPI000B8E2E26|nr:EF-hand calcium-binding domain-containing protein 2 [Zootermopsis nevadensis]